jgi:hypothetical protein
VLLIYDRQPERPKGNARLDNGVRSHNDRYLTLRNGVKQGLSNTLCLSTE